MPAIAEMLSTIAPPSRPRARMRPCRTCPVCGGLHGKLRESVRLSFRPFHQLSLDLRITCGYVFVTKHSLRRFCLQLNLFGDLGDGAFSVGGDIALRPLRAPAVALAKAL